MKRSPRSLESLFAEPLEPGSNRYRHGDMDVEVEASDADRLGATVDRLRVAGGRPGDVRRQVEQLDGRLRPLGERLAPVEVEPRLGGAVARTAPSEMEQGRFWELSIKGKGRSAELERYRVKPDGQRSREPYTLTREQVGRVVDDMAEILRAGQPVPEGEPEGS